MTVSLAQPPHAVEQVTRDRMQQIARQNDFRVEALVAAKPEQIRLDSGHPVYNVGLNDLVHGTPLARLPLTSWRFIVGSGTAAVSAAETLDGGAGGEARFASVNAGPFVDGTTQAFASVSKDPTFATGDWEMRVLRVPALYIFAVWTHDKAGNADRIRPIAPAPAYLDASRTYSWDEFVAAVRPQAEAKLAGDDGLRG